MSPSIKVGEKKEELEKRINSKKKTKKPKNQKTIKVENVEGVNKK
jgi:hypothetical protein